MAVLDRIDYNPTENILLIVDYKTGKKETGGNIPSLSQFQLPVYMQAAFQDEKIRQLIPSSETAKTKQEDSKKREIVGAYLYPLLLLEGKSELFPQIGSHELLYAQSEEDMKTKFKEAFEEPMKLLREICSLGLVFAVPHKKKKNFEEGDDKPCSHCDFSQICDKNPYEAAISQLQENPISRRYMEMLCS